MAPKQTIIYTALPNGRTTGSLRLSVFISPRLWDTVASVTKMKLSAFDDFVDWTGRVGSAAAGWQVKFDGIAPIKGTVVSVKPRADLWNALFKEDTDVIPYRFDDYRGSEIETFPSGVIHDFLVGIYTEAATNPALGGGKKLPGIDLMAQNPAIVEIAIDRTPLPFPEPSSPRPAPLDMGGKVPEPEPEPEPPQPPSKGCCLCGCLLWPFLILASPFPKLKARLKKLCAQPAPAPKPVHSTEPKPALEPPAPPLPATLEPVPTPKPPKPITVNRAAFNNLASFLKPAATVSQELPTELELKDKYDFHQMVSALADYPLLLREFGLVVDLDVSLAGAAPPLTGMVTVEADLPLTGDTIPVSPRTHYNLTADKFEAQPRLVNPEISNGMLRLNDENLFRVIQVDVVGGGTKTQAAATSICQADADPTPNMVDNSALPALRGGGISVVRVDMVNELQGRFERSHALQQAVVAIDKAPQKLDPPGAPPALPPTDELFAEDLVHGYRIDVFDSKSNEWHSLCQRVGTYDFLDAPLAIGGKINLSGLNDEGFVQFAATEPLSSPAKKKLRTSDALFVWEGWSLCAPRPGLSIMPDPKPAPGAPPAPPPDTKLDTPKNEALTNFKMETSFKAKDGSLPRLRFDYTYRLRARVCDLAGNSVFNPDDLEFADDVLEQTDDFPCARYEPVSPPPMMLLAMPVEGESLERLVVRTPAVAGELQATERHIVPPKISQVIAEQHGKFDLPTKKMDDSTTAYDTASREAGSLTTRVENDLVTGLKKVVDTDAKEIKKDIWAHKDPKFVVTYLPDPAARGALLMGLPGMANDDEIIEPVAPQNAGNKIAFDGPWPDPLPFRLRLVATPAAVPAKPQWKNTSGERVLEVQLPPAGKKVIHLSSYMDPADLDRQGVMQWVREKGAPAWLPPVEADTAAGRSWLQMPWRDITLVHAVAKPIKETTAVASVATARKLGETFAEITGNISPHVASTGKVDLIGHWTDPIDDVSKPAPGTLDHKAHLCEILVGENAVSPAIEESATGKTPIQNFGDTKFHTVRYEPIATTRFGEYFPEDITKDATKITLAGPLSNPVEILNTARPDPPKVLYIVPTFGWEPIPDVAGTTTKLRRGNGLRVYLDRPWYSSGAGELLGVVYIHNKNFLTLDERQRKYITHWGVDPIWVTPATSVAAINGNFDTPIVEGNLKLEEIPDLVTVAAFEPNFDTQRRLWFVDINMDVGNSYMPFVRLALARYQPNSVKDAELSRVVRAEFVQLAPDRRASVTTLPGIGSHSFHIKVVGLTFQQSGATFAGTRIVEFRKQPGRTGHAEIVAQLQKRDPTLGADPDIAWRNVDETLLLQNSATPGEWEGDLSLTGTFDPNTYRVLLKEQEWYRSDFQPEDFDGTISAASRIVYAVAIPVEP